MKRLKATMMIFAGLVLAGCAQESPQKGLRETDLRSDNYYRGDYVISSMNFPNLQRALFKHEAACGKGPVFVMDKNQTGYATLWLYGDDPRNLRDAIMVDLTALKSSLMAQERVKAKIYSYYNTSREEQRARSIWRAIENPGQCEAAEAR